MTRPGTGEGAGGGAVDARGVGRGARGHRVLTDRGAVREFAASLQEGLRAHVAEVAARTGAQVVVQLDEPLLPEVLAGTLPTASGYGTVRSVGPSEARTLLRELVAALGVPVVVHCCADRPPVRLLADIGAAGHRDRRHPSRVLGAHRPPGRARRLGEVWDSGTPLFLGLVPAREPDRPVSSRELAKPAFDLADRLGFDRSRLATLCVPTPTCGLAAASPTWARRALALSRELGQAFLDPPEEN